MRKTADDAHRTLTPDRRKELGEWLEQQQLNINKINRVCTDAVVVAKILKKIYPRMIDLYNYPERNSIKLKLANWSTLNVKVLSKLGLPQKPITLHKFVNADRDAIEFLLYNIMCLHKSTLKKPADVIEEDCFDANYEYTEKDAIVVNVNKEVDDEIVKVPQKMIVYTAYEQAIQNFKNYAVHLADAEQKIQELENNLKQKAAEIDQLCSQLAVQTVITMDTKIESSDEAESFDNMENSEETSSITVDN